MNPADDPFLQPGAVAEDQPFQRLTTAPMAMLAEAPPALPALPTVVLGTLRGFDLLDQPLIAHVAAAPGHVLTGRSAVPLRRAQIGRSVALAFEAGDVERPVILGVLEPSVLDATPPQAERPPQVLVDGERQVIEAEREIVLRCGEASITLTRSGKVLIKGSYILSRSSGYNKIKGAAIDIN